MINWEMSRKRRIDETSSRFVSIIDILMFFLDHAKDYYKKESTKGKVLEGSKWLSTHIV